MVRRKIDIKRIENSAKRHTTFTKRRQGLEKKAREFCRKTNSEGAVIVFSDAGNCYVFASPHITTVVNRYDAESSAALASEAGVGGRLLDANGIEEEEEEEEEEEAPATETQKRIGKAVENDRWREAVENLGVEELNELYAEMESIKSKLAAREREIEATAKDFPEGRSSVGYSSRG